MTWKSLSDVYSEQVIRDNNAATIEPSLKEWRSLSDIYSEATVSIKFNDDEVHQINLSDVYARKVLGYATFAEESLFELIVRWARTGGWSESGVKRISEQINSIFREKFPDKIDNPVEIKKIANEIRAIISYKKKRNAFAEFVKNKGDNIFTLFDLSDKSEIQTLSDKDFISALCQIDLSENKVNIGPGEVAITLFTEAKNPKKGDFYTPDTGVVELKGSDGRVGKGRKEQAVYSSVIDKAIDAKSIEQTQNNYFNDIQNLKAKFKNRILEFNLGNNKTIVSALKEIYESTTLKNFLKETKSENFTKTKSEELINKLNTFKPKVQDKSLEDFREAAKQIINLTYKIYGLKLGKEVSKFKTFFSSDIISDDRKLQTILEYVDSNITEKIQKIIMDSYKSLPVESVIGAIAIANYYSTENFNYIIFANTLPGVIQSGKLPCKVIGPFELGEYENNLQLVLDNIDKLVFSPNADRGGFQIQYTGGVAAKSASSVSADSANASTEPGAAAEGERLNIPV